MNQCSCDRSAVWSEHPAVDPHRASNHDVTKVQILIDIAVEKHPPHSIDLDAADYMPARM